MNTKLKNIFFEDSKAKMIIRNGEVIYRMLVKPIFIVDTDNIQFESSGGTTTFNITANDSWSMTIPNFVTVSSLTGYGNATITVTTTGETSETELTGNIVITCGSKTHTIAVKQKSVKPDYSTMFFTIEALSAGTIYFKKNVAAAQTCYWYVRKNDGNWSLKMSNTADTASVDLSVGDKLEIRKISSHLTSGNTTYYNYIACSSSAKFNAYGNIMSVADNTEIDDDLTTKTLTRNYQCYRTFYNCSGLVDISNVVFPNNTTNDCYREMFYGCTSLTSAPELPATSLANECYQSMFYRCLSLTTAPELPATTLVYACYFSMFAECSKFNYIKCLATNISASYCTAYWLSNVAATGTFIKASGVTWPSGNSGIPNNWTVEEE